MAQLSDDETVREILTLGKLLHDAGIEQDPLEIAAGAVRIEKASTAPSESAGVLSINVVLRKHGQSHGEAVAAVTALGLGLSN